MYCTCIGNHKYKTHKWRKKYRYHISNKCLDILSSFQKLLQYLPWLLIFENFIWKRKKMWQCLLIQSHTNFLCQHVRQIVLNIFCNSRNHSNTNTRQQQKPYSRNKCISRKIRKMRNISINNNSKDLWIQQRKDLINRCTKKSKQQ